MALGLVSGILRARATRAGPGHRRRDHRRLRGHEHAGAGTARAAPVGGPAPGQRARRRRALVRHLRVRRRRAGSRSVRSSRSSTGCCSRSAGSPARVSSRRSSTWRTGRGTRSASPALFRARTRAEWCALLEGTDVCFAPVLNLAEARRTRTTGRGRPTSRSTAWRSRRLRRASARHPPRCARPAGIGEQHTAAAACGGLHGEEIAGAPGGGCGVGRRNCRRRAAAANSLRQHRELAVELADPLRRHTRGRRVNVHACRTAALQGGGEFLPRIGIGR